MTITIREIDLDGADAMSTLLPLFRAASAVDSPRAPEPSESYLRLQIGRRAARHVSCLVVYDGERPAGFARMNHSKIANRDLVYGELWIPAEDRAESAGPLLEACRDYARGRGAARLVIDTSEFSGYDAVCGAGGGRSLAGEWRRELDLAAIDREQYTAWAAPTEKNARYRVEIWRTPTPEHLLGPLVEALDVMRDAPTGELVMETPLPDVDRRRRTEADNSAAGMQMYVAAAFAKGDGSGSEIAGFHEVFVYPDYRMAEVGNTGVPAKFRGHGLGLRLKAAMALHLLEREPHLDVLSTSNDADNAPMVRVNDAMGYQAAEAWQAWQFEV
ncbi:RimJ/RimL family protein N-acetyltransferase [Catenulispora sp. GAS73]|uniref:GNAT family N-acetyltransferase n=1 Tax=Catenulispora sp. GAS73 TaxID=3156269 RepID=UPI0035155CFB